MDLSRVQGISPEWQAALEAAGIGTTPELARASGLTDLAQRTGIPYERLEGLREAARHEVVSALRAAGVKDEAQLVEADAELLSGVTGIPREDLEWFQAAAREALSGLPARRVTLRPGNSLARVRLGEDVHEGVAIRTLSETVEPGSALAAMDGNVVVLRPGQSAAVARFQGVVHEDVPLYAETEGTEIAVRVAAIRTAEPPEAAPKKEKRGLFARMKKKE